MAHICEPLTQMDLARPAAAQANLTWLKSQRQWPISHLYSSGIDSPCALAVSSNFRFSFVMPFAHGVITFLSE